VRLVLDMFLTVFVFRFSEAPAIDRWSVCISELEKNGCFLIDLTFLPIEGERGGTEQEQAS
jgi:hypothetical protein